MKTLRRILVPTDFSAGAEQALTTALHLARRHGADLHLLHVIVPPQGRPLRFTRTDVPVHEPADKIISDFLAEALAAHSAAGINVELVKQHSPQVGPKVMAYAAEHAVDLIVLGTHGRRGVQHMLLGSVAEEIIHRAPCDVLTVHAADAQLSTGTVRRLLVPVDFSESAAPLLRRGVELAAEYDARLYLLHVIEPFPLPVYLAGIGTVYDLVPDVREQSLRHMEAMLAEAGAPKKAEVHLREGRAARSIVDFAKEHGMDLILIATHGLSGFERFFIGSVTERVVRSAASPVYCLRTAPPEEDNASEKKPAKTSASAF